MTRERFLEKARQSYRLAVLHRGLRDVSAEIADARAALAAANAQPATIGATETEFRDLIRCGLLAEARITFELAADRGSTPAERDFLFNDLVGLVTKALQAGLPPLPAAAQETKPAEEAISDAEAARLLAEHDPGKGLVPMDQARASGEFPGVSEAEIDALNFDAFGAEPQGAGSGTVEGRALPDDDPGPFIEIDPEDEDDGYPEITFETIPIAAECLMPESDGDGEVMSPESVRMAIRFFGRETAAELGLIPAPRPPVLLTKIVRTGTVPPPLPEREEEAADADA